MPLHTLTSLHDCPFGTGVKLQPDVGLQESLVQGLPSSQGRGSLRQALPTHRSFTVQALASAQFALVAQQAGKGC